MKNELDQLQSGRKTVLAHRKANAENLSEELIDIWFKILKYERDIIVRKIKLDKEMISDFMFQILQWCEICDPNEVTKICRNFRNNWKPQIASDTATR